MLAGMTKDNERITPKLYEGSYSCDLSAGAIAKIAEAVKPYLTDPEDSRTQQVPASREFCATRGVHGGEECKCFDLSYVNWEDDPDPPSEDDVEELWETLMADVPEEPDMVNSPAHYTFPGGVEVIQLSQHLTSNGGQAVQYVARATRLDGNLKGNPIEDLEKAVVLLTYEIQRLKSQKMPQV